MINPELEKEENDRLPEERTYTFEPDEKKFIVNGEGETSAVSCFSA